MKLKSSSKGFWIGAIIVAIIAYVWGKQLIQTANDSGYGAGVQNTLAGNPAGNADAGTG